MEKTHSNNYPVWELHVRPNGAKHELWQTKRVAARSAIQAQAILRRQGYEAVLETALVTNAQPDPKSVARLQPPQCSGCGYRLVGLVLESAYVTCPECSYQQPLVTWNPEFVSHPPKSAHIIIRIFAIIGVMAFVILGVLLMSTMMYY